MKKLPLLCAGILYSCMLSAQPSFQTSLEAGISLPLNSNDVNATHAGKAIHFGNHFDYTFGSAAVRVGLGAYIGYINAISTDSKFEAIGVSIAEKYRFTAASLSFNSSSFKSTQILLGPVAAFGSGRCHINIWAKAGYGLNEPSRYAVLDKENGVVNNVYVNQAGENKNGLAYNLGAGIRYALSAYTGLQLTAGYFGTQTDQVNYNFDREKGTAPLYYTAANQFIQASVGLQFTIGNADKKNKMTGIGSSSAVADTIDPSAARLKMKTKSNIKNDRTANPEVAAPEQAVIKIKTKSNIKNDRLANNAGNGATDNPDNDSLFFSPEKIELRSQAFGVAQTQLQSVDNYLTGFVYRTSGGNIISQCGSNAMPGDPVPGIDVKLRLAGAAGTDAISTRTNRDGSFAFNNIAPGNYNAAAGNSTMDITVNGNKSGFKILDINTGSCSNTKENFIITDGDKTYVEVISTGTGDSSNARKHIANIKWSSLAVVNPRDQASGLPSGKRMHKPYRVADTDFDVNMDNLASNDGKIYAEVIAAREASSGMATGRSTLITGDVDGDGLTDYTAIAPRDAATGLATGKRMHKPYVITKELDITDEEAAEIVSPRDAASGLSTGKRMHKPYVITKELDITEEEANELVSPRDAASGLSTGRRMHKPYTITKELGVTADGDDVIVYKIIHKDLATRSIAGDDNETVKQKMAITEQGVPRNNGHKKGIITGKDNDNGMYTGNEEVVASNPLYESSGAQGVNPMFEAKDALHVTGGNGKGHDIFIPSSLVIKPVGGAIIQNTSYEVGPIKWMAPESLTHETADKGIQEKGIKKNINASEASLGSGKITGATAGKGWDGTVKGYTLVKNISRVHCADGTCTIDGIVEVDGASYEAVITGVMKTKR